MRWLPLALPAAGAVLYVLYHLALRIEARLLEPERLALRAREYEQEEARRRGYDERIYTEEEPDDPHLDGS